MTCLRSIPITTKEVQVMFNSMKSLLLAGALSLAAASAVQATDGPGGPTDDTGRSHASAAPICDGTGRTQKTANDGRLSRDWCRVIATEGPPTSAGDNNGRSAALSQGGGEFRVAGGRITGSEFGH